MEKQLVIGVDFGSDSARAIVMDAQDGKKLGGADCAYPRWMRGAYCDSARAIFRQHPLDYLEAFERCVRGALESAGADAAAHVKGIAVDTTGSTPAPVDKDGLPLAMREEFRDNPNAMFYMWKDHSANEEAALVNEVLSNFENEDYTRFQGRYSSEWWWAKILHARRVAPDVCAQAVTWVEHSDWIPSLLTGRTSPARLFRNACGAGHKALWHSDFGGLPSARALETIDPYLARIANTYAAPQIAGSVVGTLTPEWARRLGLPESVVVGGGSFDAHAGAVGAGVKPKTLVKVVGTSTVDLLVEERDVLRGKDVQDVCGQAENSIIPGYIGIESGQAAFGDIFSWFRKVMMWPVRDFLSQLDGPDAAEKERLADAYEKQAIARLEEECTRAPINMDITALDWLNGRRYPMVNEAARGMIGGLTLGATAPQLFAALAMSTVFGSRRILESMVARGLQIDQIITVGGVAKKAPYIMQMMADAINRPIMVSRAEQCCATGAAIYAAVAAGIYPDVLSASRAMCERIEKTYTPDLSRKAQYDLLYKKYLNLCRHGETIQMELSALEQGAEA